MTITYQEIYKRFANQPFSPFDTELITMSDDDMNVTSAINDSLTSIYFAFPFRFRVKKRYLVTQAGINKYSKPIGDLQAVYIKNFADEDYTELEYNDKVSEVKNVGLPDKFTIYKNKITLNKIPDKQYELFIRYLNPYPVITADEEYKKIFTALDDILNIPDEYEELFVNVLIKRTMADIPILAEPIREKYMLKYDEALKTFMKVVNKNVHSSPKRFKIW